MFKHKDISLYFPSKKLTGKLPPSNDFYNAKLLEESQVLGNTVSDNEQFSVENVDNEKIKELLAKLDEANEEIRSLKETVATQNKDIKALKYLVNASNRLCVAKDIKIESLLKNRAGGAEENIITPVLFKNFENKIESSTLKQLRSFQEGQNYDSSFVLMLVRHFYAENINVLLSKSASGSGKSKTAVSPEKKKLFMEC